MCPAMTPRTALSSRSTPAPGWIVPVTAGATLTAGQEVQTDATGQAIPFAAGVKAGYVLNGAASGADAEIALY